MAGARRDRIIAAVGILVVSMLLMGCALADLWVESSDSNFYEYTGEDAIKEEPKDEHAAEADQVLASGQVLSVRINYGKSGATQCQVRIDNERNGWYDEIEDTAEAGVLGSDEKMYGDYPFGFENFNRQLTQPEYYDPKDAKGEYRITVTASTGYSATTKVTWDGERLNPSLLAFSLD